MTRGAAYGCSRGRGCPSQRVPLGRQVVSAGVLPAVGAGTVRHRRPLRIGRGRLAVRERPPHQPATAARVPRVLPWWARRFRPRRDQRRGRLDLHHRPAHTRPGRQGQLDRAGPAVGSHLRGLDLRPERGVGVVPHRRPDQPALRRERAPDARPLRHVGCAVATVPPWAAAAARRVRLVGPLHHQGVRGVAAADRCRRVRGRRGARHGQPAPVGSVPVVSDREALMLRGFDVSHHQGSEQWGYMRDVFGLSFGFAKGTQREDFRDSRFPDNWAGMANAGLVRGAYHFAEPDLDPTDDVEFFLNYVHPNRPTDLLVLDLEQSGLGQEATSTWAQEWARHARRLAPGYTPGVYMGSGYLTNRTGEELRGPFGWLWYPRYPFALQGRAA